MLSSVLKSARAVDVNIEIMRVFARLRQTFANNRELSDKLAELERKVGAHDQQIQGIFEALRQLMMPPSESERREIGFHIKEEAVVYRINHKRRR